ncbi:MAG: hypothetical protein ACE5J0_00250 [Candidatus Paceibacterales bacterium]
MEGFIKNKKFLLLLVLSGTLGIVSVTFALEINWPASPGGTQLTDTTTLPQMVQYFYEWGITIGGIATFFALVMAGFQYLTSIGRPEAMRAAMGRIQSAIFGLVLLLTSWLVLNTINPELTTLRTPSISPPSGSLEEIEFNLSTSPCEKAILYDQTGNEGNFVELTPGGGCLNLGGAPLNGVVQSIDIRGSCVLNLFPSTDSTCSGTDPTRTITFTSDSSDIGRFYGITTFGSAAMQTGAQALKTCSEACDEDCLAATGGLGTALFVSCEVGSCPSPYFNKPIGNEWCRTVESKDVCCCQCLGIGP